MNVSNPPAPTTLPEPLTATLTEIRNRRGFDPDAYLKAKASLLNAYLTAYDLSAAVVAVSGGVDSAVVAGIVSRAARCENSPLRRLLALSLPVRSERGATGQDSATARGAEVAYRFGFDWMELDLTDVHVALTDKVLDGLAGSLGPGTDWALGQAVAYVRTPALYFVTSLLSDAGTPGLICGTTNRDEGAWLGYVGKASDAMVDVQLISDLHKSEVFALGEHLGVPVSVLTTTPTGDMFDGRADVDVFGAPYDFVELHTNWLCADETTRQRWRADWGHTAGALFDELAKRLERVHHHNRHKYLAHSQAVHLDILDAQVPGGWRYGTWSPT